MHKIINGLKIIRKHPESFKKIVFCNIYKYKYKYKFKEKMMKFIK